VQTKLKSGKEEIVYLLTAVFKKYEAVSGQILVRNTNRKNYEGLAKELSQISNALPYTAIEKLHDEYPPENNPSKLGYPYLRYDITGGQIKDASNGIVANPRNFLIDTCYIYLFGVGRLGFAVNPQDVNLIKKEGGTSRKIRGIKISWLTLVPSGLFILALICWYFSYQNWQVIKKDLNILPYQPSKKEIKSLEGIWLVYIGSPQARSSDANRYHMVVNNLVDVRYKDGYFTFNRYGASFDHFGYMQFERKNLVSIHSYIRHNGQELESPRLSLMRLDQPKEKQGNEGSTEEIINTIENSSCHCKIVKWKTAEKTVTFYLKNRSIESLKDSTLRNLLDENSIILSEPEKGLLLKSEKN
jgi:hypothetical protein